MIFIYGSGGRAKLIKEALIRVGRKKKEIVLIDDSNRKTKNSKFLLKNFKKRIDQLFIGVTNPKIQNTKYKYFKKKLKDIDNKPLIDPRAILKSNVRVGKNSIILENSSIGPNVKISKNVFIGSRVIINHDCKIGAFTTIGHGSNLAGNVSVKENCVVGISSTIKQKIKISSGVIIGSASNIVKNCQKNKKYYGNPAKQHLKK